METAGMGLHEPFARVIRVIARDRIPIVLANPRNLLEVHKQGSGGFVKIVRGFASGNDAGVRFGQAQL